jgi:arylsulfate sulfotransferase
MGHVRRLRNGNFLYSSNFKGIRSLLVGMDVFGDVVQRWFPRADWAHANALSYDERDDAVIVNLRHQDATVKIDRASGRVAWILGTHDGWGAAWAPMLLRPVGPFEWPFHAHGIDITLEGTILAFDNGNGRAMPFAAGMAADQSYSRAVEFAVDAEAREVRQIWSYGGPGEDRFFSGFLGDGWRGGKVPYDPRRSS